jgi:putative endonuclease
MSHDYFIYILASDSRHLYVGITNNLHRRLAEHRAGLDEGYAFKHVAFTLVYFEQTPNIRAAIAREKAIKLLRRAKKLQLIESTNPDLARFGSWIVLKLDAGPFRSPSLRSGLLQGDKLLADASTLSPWRRVRAGRGRTRGELPPCDLARCLLPHSSPQPKQPSLRSLRTQQRVAQQLGRNQAEGGSVATVAQR